MQNKGDTLGNRELFSLKKKELKKPVGFISVVTDGRMLASRALPPL